MRNVTIAGKEYSVHYTIGATRELLKRSEKANAVQAILSPSLEDHILLVWAGLRSGKPSLTPEDVVDLLEKHRVQGGDYFKDIVVPCIYAAAVEDRVAGEINADTLEGLLKRSAGFDSGKATAE